MNPDIETFLQDAFKDIQPSVQGVGRVRVEPDYESDAVLEKPEAFAAELRKAVSVQKVDLLALGSHTGFEIDDMSKFPLLQKLVLRIALHGDGAEGPWVEVAPPGNWI